MKQKLLKPLRLRVLMLVALLCAGFTSAWGQTFTRITNVNDLSDGDEIIFVNQSETYACGTTQNANNRTPVAVSVTSHSYSYSANDNVQVFTVRKTDDGYGFHTGSGYIYSASSSSNYLKTNTTDYATVPTGTSLWSLSITDYVITAQNKDNSNYYLAFNGTSYFSQYKSGQSKPYIYKKDSSGTSTIKPNKPTITISEGVISISADGNLMVYYTTDGTDPTTTSNQYTNSFSPKSSCTIKAIAVDEGGNYSDIVSASYIYQKNVNSNYFVKVTDADVLQDGDAIIIVNDHKDYGRVLGAQNTNNRAAPQLTNKPSNGVIDGPGDDAQRIILVPAENNNWYLYTGVEGYLYAASSKDNYLKTKTSVDANSEAKITFADGNAIIKFQGSNTKNWIRHNSTNELFSCYASGQNDVQIYKEVVKPVVLVEAPTISVASGTYFEAQSVTLSCETEGATIKYSTDGETWHDYSSAITISETTTLYAKAVKGEDVSAVASATYTIAPTYANNQAANLAATATETDVRLTLTDALVVFKNSNNTYLKDATGGMLIYGASELNVGDKVTGYVDGKLYAYNGLPEIKNPTFNVTSVSSGNDVAPILVNAADLKANPMNYISQYVLVKPAIFAEDYSGETDKVTNATFTVGETELVLRNSFKLAFNVKADTEYAVAGMATVYTKDGNTAVQLYPTDAAKDVVEIPAVAKIGDVKYESLAKAVAAANANDVITLIADDNVSLTAAGSEITIDKPLTITGEVDENGKPKYTIYGSSSGTLDNNSFNDLFLSCNTGTVTVSNVKFDSFGNEKSSVMGHSPLFIGSSNNNAVVENVYFSNLNCEGIHINGGSFTINNCNIDCAKETSSVFTKGICVVNQAQGSITNTTITGVDCDDENDTSAAIELQGSGNITINGCTIQTNTIGIATTPVQDLTAGTSQVTVSNCTVESHNIAVYSNGEKGAKTTITSGFYSGLLMAGDNDEGLAISGGYFEDPIEPSYCADGFIPSENTDEATKDQYPNTVKEGSYVAEVGGEYYETFADAVAALGGDNDVITLLADIEVPYTLAQAQTLTINLNGYSVTILAPEGYVLETIPDGDATVYTYNPAVAKIGTASYASLAAAIAAVPADGTQTTITMIADDTVEEEGKMTVAVGKNIVLDLNGKTVSGTSGITASFYFITNSGTLEITDNSAEGQGKITYHSTSVESSYSKEFVTIYNLGGTLTMTNGTVENTSGGGLAYAVNNSSNAWGSDVISTFNMNGGRISAPQGDATLRVYQNCSASSSQSKNYVNITGGTVDENGIFVDTNLYKENIPADYAGGNIDTKINISGGAVVGLIDMKIRHPFNTLLNITAGDLSNTKMWVRKVANEYVEACGEPTAPMVTISGGTFAFAGDNTFGLAYDYAATTWTTYEKPYAISGGVFNKAVPAEFCADDMIPADNTDAATSEAYPYTVAQKSYVAQIGDVKYETLDDAVAAAEDGATVTLLKDVELSEGITNSGNAVLDLNGHDITGMVNGKLITNSGTLTIQGSGHIYNKDVTAQGHDAVYNTGTLTIAGGVFGDADDDQTNANGQNRGAAVRNFGGAVTINGGSYTACDNFTNGGYAYALINDNNGSMTINDANVYGKNNGNIANNYGTVTVKGGSFTLNNASSYYSLYVDGEDGVAKTIVEGGTFNNTSNNGLVHTADANNASIEISGGDFTYTKLTNQTNEALNAAVSGGTFSSPVPAEFCAEGYIPADLGEGKYGVKAGAYVAQVGEQKYETLQAAIDAAESGTTVTLLKDVELSEGITNGGNAVLDLNGHDITGMVNGKLITNSGTLTIQGSGHIYNKDVTAQGHDAVYNTGTLTIAGGVFGDADDDQTNANGQNRGAAVRNFGGAVTINGGSYTACDNFTNGGYAYALINDNNGSMTINDANVYGKNNGNIANNYGTVTVKGGSFTLNNASSYYSLYVDGEDGVAKTIVEGGTFNNTSNNGLVHTADANNASIEISGGDFTYTKLTNQTNEALNAAVSGGTFSSPVPAEFCAEGYIPADLGEGKYGVKEGVFVAKIGDVKYETLQAAVDAATDDANIITLVADIYQGKTVVNIDKTVTINGEGHSVASTATQAIGISGSGNVKINNVLITTQNRGINVLNVSSGFTLNVENSIIQTNVDDPTTVYTTGENSRGINIANADGVTVNISNSTIQGFSYSINIPSSGKNLTVNMTGGKTYGRAAVNNWGSNNTITLDGVEVHGLNNQTGETEAFACVVDNKEAQNNTFVLKDCQFTGTLSEAALATEGSTASEHLLQLSGKNAIVKVLGSTTYSCNSDDKTRGGIFYTENYLISNKLYFDDTTKQTFADAFVLSIISDEKDAEMDLYPVSFSPEVFFGYVEEGKLKGDYNNFATPFEDGSLITGYYFMAMKDFSLKKNITCTLESGEEFVLLLRDYSIDKNGYSVSLPTGVTAYTDKQTDIFSAAEAGYKIVESGSEEEGYSYTAEKVLIAAPTIFHDEGTYEGAIDVAIAGEGTIMYKLGNGEAQTYSAPIAINATTTVTAWTEKDGFKSSEVSKTFTIEAKAASAEVAEGYYTIKNNGNNKYVNVAGRKTVTFVDEAATATAAGTVIKVKAEADGVKVLRSQGVDVPGYADKAMRYVPEIVKLVVDKLNNLGEGQLMGEAGLEALMNKFNEAFDEHLYLETVGENSYRIYGRTPSMQHVVDFYAENKQYIDPKLPMLEGKINAAIEKVLEKTKGRGAGVLVPFSLETVWQNMGGTLTEPVDEASTMKFYEEVLTSETNVWNFAYETAMIYWTKVEQLINNPDPDSDYADMLENLGDYKKYLEKVPNIRPNFKYYIVQKDNKLDIISEGNGELNADFTAWTLTPRTEFSIAFNEDNMLNDKYYTTLYTDFAYTLPEGVKAYMVTEVSEAGVAKKVEMERTIPAQTPVLLEADAADTKVLTLSTEDGTAPADNILVGADALIKQYQIKTAQVEGLFKTAKDILGEDFYNNYIAEYEHLMARNAGTVNNKYFFGLTNEDMELCTYKNEDDEDDCVIRNLGTGENQPLAFYGDWQAPKSNQAFLVSEEFNPVLLKLKGDVDRDGDVDEDDLKALVEIVLGKVTVENNQKNYDFDAAHVNDDEDINIADVTALVNILNE